MVHFFRCAAAIGLAAIGLGFCITARASPFTLMDGDCAANASGVQCFEKDATGSWYAFQTIRNANVTSLSGQCAAVAGSLQCWDGPSGKYVLDNPFPSASAVKQLALARNFWSEGAWAHVCYIDSANAIKCMGSNGFGELGVPRSAPAMAPVVPVGLPSAAAVVAASKSSTCAIAGSDVYCWGLVGWDLQGAPKYDYLPRKIALPRAAVRIAMTDRTTTDGRFVSIQSCALLANSDVYCWSDISQRPPVLLLSNATALLSGNGYEKGLCAAVGGDIYCTKDGATAAKQVTSTRVWSHLGHNCGISDGKVFCWSEQGLLTEVKTTELTRSAQSIYGDQNGLIASTSTSDGSYLELLGNRTNGLVTLANRFYPRRTVSWGWKATSGLPVSAISLTPRVCTTAGTTVTLIAVGECSVRYEQNGDTNYLPASPFVLDLSVMPSCRIVPGQDDCDTDGDGILDSLEFSAGTNILRKDNDVFENSVLGRKRFVTQMYVDALSRKPEAAGAAFWEATLGQFSDPLAGRVSLAKSFIFSQEFDARQGALLRFYLVTAKAPPDQPGYTFWLNKIATDNGNVMPTAEAFAGVLSNMSNTEFVEFVMKTALGRAPTPIEISDFVTQLAAQSRGQVFERIVNSPAARAFLAPEVNVTACYLSLLQRGPDFGSRNAPGSFEVRYGLGYWAAQVRAGQGLDGLVQAFLQSQEYRKRFIE